MRQRPPDQVVADRTALGRFEQLHAVEGVAPLQIVDASVGGSYAVLRDRVLDRTPDRWGRTPSGQYSSNSTGAGWRIPTGRTTSNREERKCPAPVSQVAQARSAAGQRSGQGNSTAKSFAISIRNSISCLIFS